MPNRAQDWMDQAERDLEHSERSHRDGFHEWACFAAHQAAEKAIKALHLAHRQQVWGHVLTKLIDELPDSIDPPSEIVERCRVLDTFYIPPRYPDSHPEGPPFEHYGSLQSFQAVDYARAILDFVRAEMARRDDRS